MVLWTSHQGFHGTDAAAVAAAWLVAGLHPFVPLLWAQGYGRGLPAIIPLHTAHTLGITPWKGGRHDSREYHRPRRPLHRDKQIAERLAKLKAPV
jgi:hypothetical protein